MFKQRSAPVKNHPFSLPAPVSGIDAVSPLMKMPENRALVLENWFPRPDALETREGYESHVTGFASQVDRLWVYALATGAEKLFATNSTGVYDATTAGAVGAAAIALTDGKTIAAQINTGAGNYLMVVNGVDTLKMYDGAVWAAVAVFGATATSAYSFIEVYRQRLFLVKKNSLEIEYLASNAIAGAATNYPLGATFKRGGYIIALGTWTIDGGVGPEDKLAVITNKGEVAVFSGNDPATWSLDGVFFVGRPLGALCAYKYGGDLLILTETGVFPLSSAVQSTSIDRSKAVSQSIRPIFNAAAQLYANNQGWQIISDPAIPMLVVNIPSTPVKKQAVMNSQTLAWTFYSGWDALCFARMGAELYFGGTSAVYHITGVSDLGANITATMSQAPSRFGYGSNKKVQLARSYLTTTGSFSYKSGVASNFQDAREYTHLTRGPGTVAAVWGTAIYGVALWSGAVEVAQDWQTLPDEYTLWKSFYLQVVTNNGRVTYAGSDILLTPGGNF